MNCTNRKSKIRKAKNEEQREGNCHVAMHLDFPSFCISWWWQFVLVWQFSKPEKKKKTEEGQQTSSYLLKQLSSLIWWFRFDCKFSTDLEPDFPLIIFFTLRLCLFVTFAHAHKTKSISRLSANYFNKSFL